MSRMLVAAVAVMLGLGLAAADPTPVGGSTKYCGYRNGAISGGFSSPASCQPTLCCSQYGFCGPEPTITTDPYSAYCGSGCQPGYGNCNPGPAYFEYIGVGVPGDTVYQQNTINSIPLPSSGTFRFIVFLLSDQHPGGSSTASGVSTGSFAPVGVFRSGSGTWDPAQIGYLKARGKVMASVGGDNTYGTKWTGVNVASYVSAAKASLLSYYNNFGLDGFDIDFEDSILSGGTCSTCSAYQSWLSSWAQILTQIKGATVTSSNKNGATITFAAYDATKQAYKDLQNAMAAMGAGPDYIIYQLEFEADQSVGGLTSQLTALQAFYAPAKIIPGLGPSQLASHPGIVQGVVMPLIQSGVINGASLFTADSSSQTSPPFTTERQLWGSSSG